ncbi:MAG: efflux RND transporter periplasmic adaptor subunit [Peptostreptococcaceae bacterium]|nr:efflux RND transporter periplasmic adaptor subunit [Peptostreptococcaceae bacterium]
MFEKNENKVKWSKKKKGFVIGIGVLILLIAAAAFLIPPKNIAPIVSAGEVTEGYIEEAVSINGTIEGAEKAEIMSSSANEISSILVKEGQQVIAGQTLAKLNASDLQSQYAKAVNALSLSRTQYENAKLLFNEGAISKDELNQKKSLYNNDILTVQSYDIGDKTSIKSPINGTVTRINAVAGKVASSSINSEALFVVEDLNNLKMKVEVSEFDISKIKVGQKVKIKAEVTGDVIIFGQVEKIASTGESKNSATNEMIIPVVILIDKGQTNIISGVSAKASILIQSKEKALIVPIDSILEDPETGENSIVLLNADETVKIILVKLGIEGTLDVEVISSKLKVRDKIILNPGFDLKDGATVRIQEEAGSRNE